MNRFIQHTLWLISLFAWPLVGRGQGNAGDQNYLFGHSSPANGLSQGSGYDLTGFDDFMWFGMQDGLNRFDGYTFNVYKTGDPQLMHKKEGGTVQIRIELINQFYNIHTQATVEDLIDSYGNPAGTKVVVNIPI